MAGTITVSTISDGTNSTSSTNCIQGSAKAWVQFSPAGGVITVNASYNVTSVSIASTGTYAVNFTNAFADTKYAAIGTSSPNSGTYGTFVCSNSVAGANPSSQTTTSCPIYIVQAGSTSTATNPNIVSIAFYR